MVLATDAKGNELLEVRLGDETSEMLDAPLTGALVVVTGPEGVLLVHDVWRNQWEVPGGGLEAGESSEEAALREVAEESGQPLRDLRRVGTATFRLVSHGGLERADLFRGEVSQVAAFSASAEVDGICWWDGRSPLTGLGLIDAELVRLVSAIPGPPED